MLTCKRFHWSSILKPQLLLEGTYPLNAQLTAYDNNKIPFPGPHLPLPLPTITQLYNFFGVILLFWDIYNRNACDLSVHCTYSSLILFLGSLSQVLDWFSSGEITTCDGTMPIWKSALWKLCAAIAPPQSRCILLKWDCPLWVGQEQSVIGCSSTWHIFYLLYILSW